MYFRKGFPLKTKTVLKYQRLCRITPPIHPSAKCMCEVKKISFMLVGNRSPEAYLGPNQRSTMELFSKNS